MQPLGCNTNTHSFAAATLHIVAVLFVVVNSIERDIECDVRRGLEPGLGILYIRWGCIGGEAGVNANIGVGCVGPIGTTRCEGAATGSVPDSRRSSRVTVTGSR